MRLWSFLAPMLMIQPRDVFRFVLNRHGHMPKIQQEHVYLDALMKHLDKIIQDNAYRIVQIGEPMLTIPLLSAYKHVLLTHLLITLQTDALPNALQVHLLTIQHGHV